MGASDAAFDGVGAAWGFAAPSRLLHQLTLTWDALNAKWNEWILGYGPETQNSFMKWLGMEDPNWRKMMLTLVGLVIGIVMLISVVMMLRYRPPAKDAAAILYQRFVRKTGLDPRPAKPPRVFAQRVQASRPHAAPSVE